MTIIEDLSQKIEVLLHGSVCQTGLLDIGLKAYAMRVSVTIQVALAKSTITYIFSIKSQEKGRDTLGNDR